MKYIETYFRIQSPYNVSGWESEESKRRFLSEVHSLFRESGWEIQKGRSSGSSDSATRGKEELYLHPMSFSGVILESSISEIQKVLSSGKSFRCYQVDTYKTPMDVSTLEHYETVRPLLSIRMCDPELNREYLKDKPHIPCGELAAFYRIEVAADQEGTASVAVTESLVQSWGITKEQLHRDAVQAESERNPVCFYDMNDVMSEIMFSKKTENLFYQKEPLDIRFMPLYVLTNQNKVNGAGVLAQDGVLEKIGVLIGSDFYVLPSSIHEVLIVPDNGNMQLAELEDMVREVNATQVAPEERLSDKVQYYNRETKTLGRK